MVTCLSWEVEVGWGTSPRLPRFKVPALSTPPPPALITCYSVDWGWTQPHAQAGLGVEWGGVRKNWSPSWRKHSPLRTLLPTKPVP